jgi:hypothetical protein
MRRFRGPGKKPKLSREERLAKRRETRKPLTPIQQAENRIRCLEWREKRIQSGGCTQCKEPSTHGLLCEKHWFKMVAYSHKLTPHEACVSMIKDMWREQDGRCALTGLPLSVNSGPRARTWNSASLDHKIAKASGGTNSRENLQWVLFGVNSAKADMSLSDFIGMCRHVVDHQDAKVLPIRKV